MSRPDGWRCDACQFWTANEYRGELPGLCKRFPFHVAMWMFPADWCGEFKCEPGIVIAGAVTIRNPESDAEEA